MHHLRISRLIVLLLLVALPVRAQSVTCDTPGPTVTGGSASTVVVGWAELDSDSPPQPAVAKGWTVTDVFNGVTSTVPIVMTRATSVPNAAGLYCYTGVLTGAKGTHVYSLNVLVDDGVGNSLAAVLPTNSVTDRVIGKPPKAATNFKLTPPPAP